MAGPIGHDGDEHGARMKPDSPLYAKDGLNRHGMRHAEPFGNSAGLVILWHRHVTAVASRIHKAISRHIRTHPR